jgi:hypothetical protein
MTHFAVGEVDEDIVGKDDCNIGFGSGFPFVHSSCLLCIYGPGGSLTVLGDLKFKDTVSLEEFRDMSENGKMGERRNLFHQGLPFRVGGPCKAGLKVGNELGRLSADMSYSGRGVHPVGRTLKPGTLMSDIFST